MQFRHTRSGIVTPRHDRSLRAMAQFLQIPFRNNAKGLELLPGTYQYVQEAARVIFNGFLCLEAARQNFGSDSRVCRCEPPPSIKESCFGTTQHIFLKCSFRCVGIVPCEYVTPSPRSTCNTLSRVESKSDRTAHLHPSFSHDTVCS